ncbi:hypothetical protein HD597_012891 [Nonomuraea thailandensis]|uniref:Uncharacterized protein n=1 Tax=Nonomuraea thailandensis TaxID=1188745 RepID=A0A9X2GXP2_9ACTN|nr:hypothetical protein [Nonomuraea thailandensis]MCP2365787.1 hypothetical protein [Nonomuraea thailandensis]
MADARTRATDKRARRRSFHLNRIETAPSLMEKLEAAFGLLRAEIKNGDPAKAQQIGLEAIDYLISASDRIPRRTS